VSLFDVTAVGLRFGDLGHGLLVDYPRTMARERILLVEDDVGIRRATAMSLEHEGYLVLEAGDSDEAFQRTLDADVVVAGLGIEPSTELAAAAGLSVDNGIPVDEAGRADGNQDVFAAGDVARFPVAALGSAMRVEHEDHAKSHDAWSVGTRPG
jgi:NADPH-dependent 2,4-dienoyl-CoA reductase/sulfur reductase-like enzyme